MKAFIKYILITSVMVLGIYITSNQTFAATITVDSNLDTETTDGDCTLREAIANADGNTDTTSGDCVSGSGTDIIIFSEPMTITPASGFVINSPILFNAETGGIGTCTTKDLGVIIDANLHEETIFSFAAGSDGSTLRGFVLKNADHVLGGSIYAESNNLTVSCNIIGLDETGTTVTATNSKVAIHLFDSSGHTIGGSNAGDGNIISGHDIWGVWLEDVTSIIISGNIIGLDITGTVSMETMETGINIDNATDVMIGGTTVAERNIISGNEKNSGAEGIVVQGPGVASSNITIQGNYIGTDITGTINLENTQQAIEICGPTTCDQDALESSDITIGGVNPGEGNLILGDITISGTTDVVVQGNTLGLASDGVTELATGGVAGINFSFSDNITIGGSTAGAGNYVVGNTVAGVTLLFSDNVTVSGNHIGVGTDDETIIPNTIGVYVLGGESITIGGTTVAERNIISGNIEYGIKSETGTADLTISGNYIGILSDGETEAPNESGGILVISGSSTIGGTTPEEGNLIANQIPNILIAGGTSTIQNNEIIGGLGIGHMFGGTVSVLQNSIYNNFVGFNLAIDGDALGTRTVNDAGDGDSGPNDFLNYPEFTGATDAGAGVINLTYELDVPAGYYRVEFFSNPTELPEEFAFGVGEAYVDYDTFVSTGSSKSQTKAITATITDGITATATKCTDATCTAFEETSEFSDELEAFIQVSSNTGSSSGGGGSSGGVIYGCKDSSALNYNQFSISTPSLCIYPAGHTVSTVLKTGSLCPAKQQLTQNLKAPSRNGVYNGYTKGIVTQAKILQAHLNRLGFKSGREDGILGPISSGAIKRLQVYLGAKPDGYVGPVTRELLNNSCT